MENWLLRSQKEPRLREDVPNFGELREDLLEEPMNQKHTSASTGSGPRHNLPLTRPLRACKLL